LLYSVIRSGMFSCTWKTSFIHWAVSAKTNANKSHIKTWNNSSCTEECS
jgi:hypothetical protein